MATSPLASPSATLEVLTRHGLYTKKSLGQHFLVDDNVVRRTLELADLTSADTVLEVGPGIGTLTVALCSAAGAVVAVERDADLAGVLAETVNSFPRFALVRGDAVEVTPDALSAPFGAPTALVANLPYQVAATVVLRYFQIMPTLRHMTVMVQSEVADRMSAVPGTKAYGAYTVKLRLLARPTGRFAVAPGCFLPPPRVESSVIRLDRDPIVDDAELLREASAVADAAFAQRRKTLRNSLRAALGVSSATLEEALVAARLDGGLRAEALEPQDFVSLALALRASRA